MSISATSTSLFFNSACQISFPKNDGTDKGPALAAVPAGRVAAYQHNQTDLEYLCAEVGAVDMADGIARKWEGPDLDAARMAVFQPWSKIMISSTSNSVLLAQQSDCFRPNPNGDGTTEYRTEQGFMDYTDDSCMGFAAERNRQRVSDGTSNTLQCSEG